MYLCSLSVYYFCIIQLKMRDQTFKKMEPILHAGPIIYSLVVGIFAFSKHYFNNAGSVCYVAPSPITCEILPDVECNRGEGATEFRTNFLTFPSMVIFVIVCTIMSIITYSVVRQERRQTRYSLPRPSDSEASISDDISEGVHKDSNGSFSVWSIFQSIGSKISDVIFCVSLSERNNNEMDGNTTPEESDGPSQPKRSSMTAASSSSVSNQRRSARSSHSTASRSSRNRIREITTQALLYVGCYVLSYGFVWANTIYSIATNQPSLEFLRILSSIFFPLQGFLNVFIYCRPHIVSLRRNFPNEYSWLQAFIKVLKSGGDDPLTRQERRMIRRLSNITFSQKTTTERTSSNLNSVDCSGTGTNDSIAAMIHKSELCERRSSLTSRTDIEDQSVEKELSTRVVSQHSKNRKKTISIPQGDAEEAPSSTDCNLGESRRDVSRPCNFGAPKNAIWKGDDSCSFRTSRTEDITTDPNQGQTESLVVDDARSSVTTSGCGNEDDDCEGNNSTSVDRDIPCALEDVIHETEEVLDNAMEELSLASSCSSEAEVQEMNADDREE